MSVVRPEHHSNDLMQRQTDVEEGFKVLYGYMDCRNQARKHEVGAH
jgi:hypothetical protein